jgi:hypothetical protein
MEYKLPGYFAKFIWCSFYVYFGKWLNLICHFAIWLFCQVDFTTLPSPVCQITLPRLHSQMAISTLPKSISPYGLPE